VVAPVVKVHLEKYNSTMAVEMKVSGAKLNDREPQIPVTPTTNSK
jgi:hypothetical protein